MAIFAETTDPAGLLKALHDIFDDKDTNPRTWIRDSAKEFTHRPPQWINEGWFRPIKPKKGDKELKFSFVTYNFPDRKKTNDDVYPYYHGRFVEMLIAYLGEDITRIIVTPTSDSIDDLED